uniref:Cell division control protein n=1 Tax=Blastobotrys adeninivorans TaxID=409370 RepID=A0A060T8H1_BLAAD
MPLARREPKRPLVRKEPKRPLEQTESDEATPVPEAPHTPKRQRTIDVLTPQKKPRMDEGGDKPNSERSTDNYLLTPPSTPSTVYSLGKALFQRGTVANGLVGRDSERQNLLDFFRPKVLNRLNGALYIAGLPGTGKSALLREVLDTVQEEMTGATKDMDLCIVNLNCMIIEKPELVYPTILRDMGHSSKGEDPVNELERMFLDKQKRTRHVVVLDELDHLITKDQEVLFKIFQWAFAEGSSLILVGIANALDLTDRFVPRLRANNLTPETFVFTPYEAQDIARIIESRLKSLTGQEYVPLMHPAAIQLAARKTAANTGDLRKAFDICRRAIELVEEEVRRKNAQAAQPNPDESGTYKQAIVHGDMTSLTLSEAPRVTVMHISKICSLAFGGSTVARIKGLNLQQKAVLAVLVRAERTMGSAPGPRMNVMGLFEEYGKTCSRDKLLTRLQLGEFFDLISALEFSGLVTISGVCKRKGLGSAQSRGRVSRGGSGATSSKSSYLGARDDYSQRRISSNVHYLDMVTAIEDVGLLKKIILN